MRSPGSLPGCRLVGPARRRLQAGQPADDIEVVGAAADGAAAVTAAAALRPDVVLMDVRMPRLDGLAATGRILAADPTVKVVVLMTFNEDGYVQGALRMGASGFLLKVAPPERLVEAVGDATIKTHVARILMKLRLRDRVQAVIHAYEYLRLRARPGTAG